MGNGFDLLIGTRSDSGKQELAGAFGFSTALSSDALF
jgi:hypothetical protein